uniref:Uncharacterized protein n=2 Tax=Physcomitrium patens TaxID=3218 RepID=A0A2K1J0V5_PHYPA|nr:hypothetical protein PHYPA_023057 [Physcomitrium patens]
MAPLSPHPPPLSAWLSLNVRLIMRLQGQAVYLAHCKEVKKEVRRGAEEEERRLIAATKRERRGGRERGRGREGEGERERERGRGAESKQASSGAHPPLPQYNVRGRETACAH